MSRIPTFKERKSYLIFATTLFVAGIYPLYSADKWGELVVALAYVGIGFVVLLFILFWPEKIPPRKKAFKRADIIWAMWYSGKNVLDEGLIEEYHCKIKKLLLLNPEKMKNSLIHDNTSIKEVIKMTKLAQDYGICVKWNNTGLNRTFTFYNPDALSSKKAWLLWQGARPDKPFPEWEKHRYPKGNDVYNRSLEEFNNIWNNNSENPDLTKYLTENEDEKRRVN